MSLISVSEAARRLGVGVQRVHQRIADGSLPAERVGSQWIVDEIDVLPLLDRRDPGRPLSWRSSWALIAMAAAPAPPERDQESEWVAWLQALTPVERSRASRRLEDLLAVLPADPSSKEYAEAVPVFAARLRSLLRKRAERRLYRASPRDLRDVRDDERILRSGLSHSRSGVASGDIVEGYLARHDLDDLVEDYLLDEVARDGDANVVLHVVADHAELVARPSPDESPILVAADLAEHRRPQEEARAAEIMHSLAEVGPNYEASGGKGGLTRTAAAAGRRRRAAGRSRP